MNPMRSANLGRARAERFFLGCVCPFLILNSPVLPHPPIRLIDNQWGLSILLNISPSFCGASTVSNGRSKFQVTGPRPTGVSSLSVRSRVLLLSSDLMRLNHFGVKYYLFFLLLQSPPVAVKYGASLERARRPFKCCRSVSLDG